MITGICRIIIPVRDYQKAIDFYTNKLGLVLVVSDALIDHYEVAAPGSKNPGSCFNEEKDSSGEQTGITFSTDDIKATCQVLREKGVKITEPYQAHGQWWAGLKDPDGNSYGLQQV